MVLHCCCCLLSCRRQCADGLLGSRWWQVQVVTCDFLASSNRTLRVWRAAHLSLATAQRSIGLNFVFFPLFPFSFLFFFFPLFPFLFFLFFFFFFKFGVSKHEKFAHFDPSVKQNSRAPANYEAAHPKRKRGVLADK
jgi:hypothetical protein